ncbi:hypothetical protein [Lysobacter sp. CA199]|uniref:hypothetical protein n=1 Tax=Lysobacter sp. CA199 TaxID=3455608 RepID=UPI003F8D5116
MKSTMRTAGGKLHTATMAGLPLRGREGGACLFTADLSWARERAPARVQRRLRGAHLARVALFALLAMAVVGVVIINGPADAGPNRTAASALPDPISEAEVEVDHAIPVPVAASRAAYAVQERGQAAR